MDRASPHPLRSFNVLTCGRFYFTGHNVGLLDLARLRAHLETMVKMSPLLSYSLEILPDDDETALLGASVSALRALTW